MSVRTVRFNKDEERMLQEVLSFYGRDFSGSVKELISEKPEGLRDIGRVKRIKEGRGESECRSAEEISRMFDAASSSSLVAFRDARRTYRAGAKLRARKPVNQERKR